MDLKQSYISLGWKLDTSNLDKAKSATDNLVNTIKENGVAASKLFAKSFSSIDDKIDNTKNKTKSWIDVQKSINDVSITNPTRDMDKFDNSIGKSINVVDKLKAKLDSINGDHETNIKVNQSGNGENFKPSKLHLFSNITAGVTAGNLLSNAISGITSKLKEAAGAGMQYDQNQQKMNATWTTLTGNADKAKDMVDTVNDLSVKTGQATDTVDELEQGFYHLNSNKKESDALTKSMLNMSDAVGLTTPKIQAVTQDMVNGLSRGRANGGMLNQISQYFPMFREQLAKYETQIHNGKKVTVADLTSMAKSGKISAQDIENVFNRLGSGKYDKAADNMLQTMVGMQRTIKARVPALIGAFEEPIMKAKNPLYGTISKWVSDKHTQSEFTKMGDATSKGINTITNAFAKAYGLKNGTKAMDDMVTHLTDGITKLSNGIAKDAPEIKDFFSMTKDTGVGSLKLFASVMSDVAKITLPFLNFAIKHEHTVVPLLAGLFVANKALKFAGALRSVASAIGMVKAAGQGSLSGNGSVLSDVLNYGTSIGGKGKTKSFIKPTTSGEFSSAIDPSQLSFGKSGRILSKRIKGTDLRSNGAFKGYGSVSNAETSGAYRGVANDFRYSSTGIGSGSKLGTFAEDASKASRLSRFGKFAGLGTMLFGGTKLGSLASRGIGKAGSLVTKTGGFAKNSRLLSGVKGVASKVPFLDVAAAGMNLVGTNKHNAGSKIGSSAGMLGGSVLGGAVGGPIGAMAGGWLGQKLGGGVGKTIQKALPKHPFKSLESGWDSVTKKIGHSSFGKSIGKDLKPVGKSFSSMWGTIKKTTSSTWESVSKAFAPVGKSFKSMWGVVKPIAESSLKMFGSALPHVVKCLGTVFGTTFKVMGGVVGSAFKIIGSVLSGSFRAIKGTFELFKGVFTGNWKEMWSGVKDIFGGVWDAIKGTFSTVINGIKNTLSGFFKGVGKFVSHPIESIKEGLGFASGTSHYPQGLPKATRAVVNDGTGPELISFGGNLGMYKGRNVHTVLPKGSHVYNANDTRKLVGEHHFAGGTTNLNTNIKVGKNNLASSIQASGKAANTNFTKMSRALNNQNTQMHNKMFKTTSDSAKKITANNQQLSDKTVSNFTDMGKQLNPIWNKTVTAFGNYFNQLGPNAKSAMQGAVDSLNGGITGIDKTLQQFGGNDSVLSPIHYSDGTDTVKHDHLAIVNDAKNGPQTEAIVNQAGGVRYAKGTNAKAIIHKGEAVLTGQDTMTAIKEGLIPHYAKGAGSKSALRRLAKTNAKNATGAFNSEFTKNVHLKGYGLQKGLTKMASNASANINTGYKWSGAMWHVINNAIQDNGAVSGLLGAVEKYGSGKKYVWGATGPDSFDCSGLVQYALKHAFGISYPRTSSAQIAKASSISRSDAQPGDLVGNAEHIGVVADSGAHHYFSAFNPSSHPNILMTPLNSTYFPGTPKFGRVSGIKNKNNGSGIKGVSPYMKKLVTAELGSSALNAITNKLSNGGASGNPAGDGVQRWKPDVVKALGALHLSTSSNMVNRVLRQINTESSGNPNAVGGTDGLADGKAMGLMQVKPGTFAEYGKPSLGKWNNGYASIYAGLNYDKHRYGNSLSNLGNGHGYAQGGRPQVGETAWVGEKGPELVHFDSPSTVSSNIKSVSSLRRQNAQKGSRGNVVNFAKGAFTFIIKEAKNAKATTKAVEKAVDSVLKKHLDEEIRDLNGGNA